jgi:hypothetical protein
MNLLKNGETLDQKLRPTEGDWAFGSIVRCTLGTVDESGNVRRTKNVVGPLASMRGEESWIRKCVSTYFRAFPPRLETVVLLSNDDNYVDASFRAFAAVDETIRMMPGNAVAYGNERVTFVHMVHPAALRGRIDEPGPGNHVANWFAGGADSQGRKQQQALRALQNRSYGQSRSAGRII